MAVECPDCGVARHVLSDAVRAGWSAVPYAPNNSYPARQSSTDERMTMLWTLFVVLLLLWLLGVVSSYTLGGFIHVLLGTGGRRRTRAVDYRQTSRLTRPSHDTCDLRLESA